MALGKLMVISRTSLRPTPRSQKRGQVFFQLGALPEKGSVSVQVTRWQGSNMLFTSIFPAIQVGQTKGSDWQVTEPAVVPENLSTQQPWLRVQVLVLPESVQVVRAVVEVKVRSARVREQAEMWLVPQVWVVTRVLASLSTQTILSTSVLRTSMVSMMISAFPSLMVQSTMIKDSRALVLLVQRSQAALAVMVVHSLLVTGVVKSTAKPVFVNAWEGALSNTSMSKVLGLVPAVPAVWGKVNVNVVVPTPLPLAVKGILGLQEFPSAAVMVNVSKLTVRRTHRAIRRRVFIFLFIMTNIIFCVVIQSPLSNSSVKSMQNLFNYLSSFLTFFGLQITSALLATLYFHQSFLRSFTIFAFIPIS